MPKDKNKITLAEMEEQKIDPITQKESNAKEAEDLAENNIKPTETAKKKEKDDPQPPLRLFENAQDPAMNAAGRVFGGLLGATTSAISGIGDVGKFLLTASKKKTEQNNVEVSPGNQDNSKKEEESENIVKTGLKK